MVKLEDAVTCLEIGYRPQPLDFRPQRCFQFVLATSASIESFVGVSDDQTMSFAVPFVLSRYFSSCLWKVSMQDEIKIEVAHPQLRWVNVLSMPTYLWT